MILTRFWTLVRFIPYKNAESCHFCLKTNKTDEMCQEKRTKSRICVRHIKKRTKFENRVNDGSKNIANRKDGVVKYTYKYLEGDIL